MEARESGEVDKAAHSGPTVKWTWQHRVGTHQRGQDSRDGTALQGPVGVDETRHGGDENQFITHVHSPPYRGYSFPHDGHVVPQPPPALESSNHGMFSITALICAILFQAAPQKGLGKGDPCLKSISTARQELWRTHMKSFVP